MSKVAIVTGGSKGIGFAVVQRLLTSGYQVHNLDIEPSESGVFHQCDVSNVTAVRQCIQAIIEKTQRIDVLVSKLISFNPNFCSAISKLHFVRVEFSKNKFDTY